MRLSLAFALHRVLYAAAYDPIRQGFCDAPVCGRRRVEVPWISMRRLAYDSGSLNSTAPRRLSALSAPAAALGFTSSRAIELDLGDQCEWTLAHCVSFQRRKCLRCRDRGLSLTVSGHGETLTTASKLLREGWCCLRYIPAEPLADELRRARLVGACSCSEAAGAGQPGVGDRRRASAASRRRRPCGLAATFGTGAAFWINLQSQYDLALAETGIGEADRRRGRSRRLSISLETELPLPLVPAKAGTQT